MSKLGLTFVLGDRLPLICDAVLAIYSVSKKANGQKRKDAVQAYSKALENMWIKSFGKEHVFSIKAIRTALEKHLTDFNNKVVIKASRKSKKHKTDEPSTSSIQSFRCCIKEWRYSEVPVSKYKGKSRQKMLTNNDLFNIGVDMESVTENELTFYEDQMTTRKCRLSEEIDEEYEKQCTEKTEEIELANSFIFDNEFDEVVTPQKSRSHPDIDVDRRPISCNKKVQVCLETIPEIRKVRNTTEEIKNAVATVSYRAGISVPKARVAVQAVCEKLYKHKYQLKPTLPTINEEDEPTEPVCKKPRKHEEYTIYKDVLPSAKTINSYKHNKALQQEIDAAVALKNKDEKTKITLHYDTTSRSRIDGEWPALILNFISPDPSKKQMINLRPLFFAFENREQIVKLIVETLKRLALTLESVTAKDLWERIDSIMTDAVTKNLNIEKTIAEELNSDYVPYHLLCKSHTCEKFDACNVQTLGDLEAKIKLREQIESREPPLKSYLR